MAPTKQTLERLPLPLLLGLVAETWRQSKNDCQQCNAPLYALRGATSKITHYERCPACHWNYITKDHSRVFDRHADLLLDVAATRIDLTLRPPKRTDPIGSQEQPR